MSEEQWWLPPGVPAGRPTSRQAISGNTKLVWAGRNYEQNPSPQGSPNKEAKLRDLH